MIREDTLGNEVLTGEYWGFPGITVEDAVGQAPMSADRIGVWGWQDKGAAESLFRYLTWIRAGSEVEEEQLPSKGNLEASSAPYPIGSVFVLDWERLKIGLVPSNLRFANDPIEEPYARYWRSHQRGNSLMFGRHVLSFEDQRAIYTRCLEWGVMIQKGRIVTWPFDSPRISNNGLIVPLGRPDQSMALRMPVPVDTTSQYEDHIDGPRTILSRLAAVTQLKIEQVIDSDEGKQGPKIPSFNAWKIIGSLLTPKWVPTHA